MSNPPSSALIDYIKYKHTEYYAKILELRTEVEEWLAYVPNTFQHYTSHTIKHSDEIVNQISKLLFKDGNWEKLVIKLSGVEAYILVAAAYLHDAGMVTSEKEKSEILESESWKKWISSEESREKRWNDIKLQREENPAVTDEATRNFLADLQTRFMIAEFIRGQHHLRAANVIELHHDKLGRIDFGSRMLREAIAQVCVGHGLRQHELEDNERFPESRDIKGETVNLRFLAILLRLGDLLDMSETRACPLLLNAASPLPPDSLAHWSQYEAIRHQFTSPEVIEVTAECANQDEDRVLRDWCQWIVDEVRNAKVVMDKARRHKDWQVPNASMEGDNPTIKIRPAKNAKYIPSKWILDFDKQAIFNLLSEDLYKNPMVFVRELIQNSLDAIRCKMYSDLEKEGKEIPEYPTQAPEDIRARYSVRLSILEGEKIKQISGKAEKEQVLIIEDDGIGMDTDIIEKYFLQVGRSFYKSDEFRRKFHFVPTSRFGIGFLSVFAASDNVTVDTFKPTSEIQGNTAVKITLKGLRNYLLRDKSERERAGTRIEIVLREDIEPGELTELVSDWCKRVEFPVYVDDFGEETVITAERPESLTFEHQLVTNPNAKFVLKAFPVDCHGIEGEIYILTYIDEKGESWVDTISKIFQYSGSHPLAKTLNSAGMLECLHGIKLIYDYSPFNNFSFHFDFRDKKYLPTLSRGSVTLSMKDKEELIPEIEIEYEKILTKHLAETALANSQESWKYKQELMDEFPLSVFWDSVPETIRIYIDNGFKLISLEDLLNFEEFSVVKKFEFLNYTNRYENFDENIENIISESKMNLPVISNNDINFISGYFLNKIFLNNYVVNKIDWLSDNYIQLYWIKNKGKVIIGNRMKLFVDFGRDDLLTLKANNYGDSRIVYNKNHPFGQWLMNIIHALNSEQPFITENKLAQLINKFEEVTGYSDIHHLENLKKYVEGFRNIPNLPVDLQPPDTEITLSMFGIQDEVENNE